MAFFWKVFFFLILSYIVALVLKHVFVYLCTVFINDSIQSEIGAIEFPTWRVMGSWWPFGRRDMIQEHNYLWSNHGPLALYDRATGSNAQEHEIKHHHATELNTKNAWFGSCDKVALAMTTFQREPIRTVLWNDVLFDPGSIKGLLAVVAESCAGNIESVGFRFDNHPSSIHLKNGQVVSGYIKHIQDIHILSNTHRESGDNFVIHGDDLYVDALHVKDNSEIEKQDIDFIRYESELDLSPIEFLNTIRKWVRDGSMFIIESSSGHELWHYAFDGFLTEVSFFNSDIPVTYDTLMMTPSHTRILNVKLIVFSNYDKHIVYWFSVKVDAFGRPVDTGIWMNGSPVPDFIWRVKSPKNPSQYPPINRRNPNIHIPLVIDLYHASI